MKKILLISFMLLSALINESWAQERTVSGNVSSKEDGSTLPGVNIVIKGTTDGTTSDLDGNYKLSVPAEGGILVFSFIGMTNQEIEIGSRSVIDVILSEDAQQLNEVVVTAIGIEQNKRTLGYALQNVDAQEIVNARETNIVNGLAGKIAGVQINSSGGQAGSSSRIIIRGNSSLLGNNQPLFVIDGIPIDNSQNQAAPNTVEGSVFNGSGSNRAIDIDPNVIENVSVLKGAAATALYGSRGANGVIVITTKRGSKKGSGPTVTISSSFGIDNPIVKGFQHEYLQGSGGNYRNGLPAGAGGFRSQDPATNPTGLTATQTSVSWGPSINRMDQYTLDSIGLPKIYDPRDDFYRDAKTLENNITISGGKDIISYLVSYSQLDQEGIAPGNEFDRKSLMASMDVQFSDKIKYSGSINYINSYNRRLTEGNGQRSYLYGLNFWPISHDVTKYLTDDGTYYTYNGGTFNNPFWLAENNGRFSTTNRFILNQSITYQILPWLSVSNRFGVDFYHDLQEDHVNIGTRGTADGRMFNADITNTQMNNDFIVSVNKDINDDFRISGLVGNNINTQTYKNDLIRGIELNIPGFFDISNASTQEAYEYDSELRNYSAYFSAGLDYKNMLFLNVTGRNDWSSSLPKNANSFFYPSVSVGFVFTDLLPVSEEIFPYGKFRASWAQAGNTASPYNTIQTFTQSAPGDGTRGAITIPTQGQNAFEQTNIKANNELVHELVTEIEIGGDFRFLNNRLGVDFAYYNRKSTNQIVDAPVAPSTGFVEATKNVGKVENKGVELTLTGTPLKMDNGLVWDVQVNFAKNKTVVNELTPGVESIFLYGFTSPQIRADVDNGYGTIWGQRFSRTEDGQLLIGEDGLPIPDDALGSIGNVQPDWTGGIRNSFSWKGITLSSLFDIRKGGDILNFDLYYSTYYGTSSITADRGSVIVWDGVVDNGDGTFRKNDIPVVKDQTYYTGFYSSYDELFVEDASFIKLRELSVSYALPSSLLESTPFKNVSFSVIGRNLWIKSNFTYWDPEGSLGGNGNGQGFYHGVTPGTQSLSFRLKASF
ncbi:SusC/RagA family TonB-linked outer membrane protein [Reichenbachiella sp. MALMAid0571]|uniref:SusC/RagA family TonB-linked outer membrane protein n=1 Tax=Reichenbachiella sp. MALMAid0571 TaxID=3143939 RepID=UPI0032DF2452